MSIDLVTPSSNTVSNYLESLSFSFFCVMMLNYIMMICGLEKYPLTAL
jgi:hypothetical protein